MRRKLWLLAAALALSVTPALAQALSDYVPRQDGALRCWQRVYDADHLARHPDQLVTQMTFGMVYQAASEEGAEQVWFGVNVGMRGEKSGHASGPCYSDAGSVKCGVECDGGGFELTLRDNGNLLLDLEKRGYIRLFGECAGGDPESTFELESGVDDKQFLLRQADAKLCKGLSEW